MTERSDHSQTFDICLLLRAHGEQRWLISEVIPVVRQLELPGSIPEEQRGAALSYLELLWLDACLRAAGTDSAHAQLDRAAGHGNRVLYERALRYHAAVRRLRAAVAARVTRLLAAPSDASTHEHASS